MNTTIDNGTPSAEPLATSITWLGSGLVRPECVLATAGGDIYTSDWRGGVVHRNPDGGQTLYRGHPVDGIELRPNGIALTADGSFLLAHLGPTEGGVFRLERSGAVQPWLQRVEGMDLPPTNFVALDAHGRTWITVSTRKQPRSLGYRRSCDDGFIVRVDDRGAAIVADGLGYTNEIAFDASGRWLYVNETFARRLSRYPIDGHGDLGAKQVFTEFGPGTFPDGLAIDEDGAVWVVSIVSNRLIRVSADGTQTVWLDDADPTQLAAVEAAYEQDDLGRPHLDTNFGSTLRNISSLAFSGTDRRTGLLGCLLGDSVAAVRMPSPGLAPHHWHFR